MLADISNLAYILKQIYRSASSLWICENFIVVMPEKEEGVCVQDGKSISHHSTNADLRIKAVKSLWSSA
jgi:hypothetical protein